MKKFPEQAVLSLLAALLCGAACAETEFLSGEYAAADGQMLLYRWLRPDDAGERLPLVLFFHGSAERGSDNQSQLKLQAKALADPALRAEFPCYVLAPQCPVSERWVPPDYKNETWIMPPEIAPPLGRTVELLNAFTAMYNVDTNRIYLIGVSMGGSAVLDLLARYPGRFAGAVCIAGAGDVGMSAEIGRTPVWFIHGDQDSIVPLRHVQRIIDRLNEQHAVYNATIYPDEGHEIIWKRSLLTGETLSWLFSRSALSKFRLNNGREPESAESAGMKDKR